jgi:hypothetical protein
MSALIGLKSASLLQHEMLADVRYGSCMDDARGARGKSGISAKGSGAAMYPAFKCSRYGRWP